MLKPSRSLATKWTMTLAGGLSLIISVVGILLFRSIQQETFLEIERSGRSIAQAFAEILQEEPLLFQTERAQPIAYRFADKLSKVDRIVLMDHAGVVVADSRRGAAASKTASDLEMAVPLEPRDQVRQFSEGDRLFLEIIKPIQGPYDSHRKTDIAGILLVRLHLAQAESQIQWTFLKLFALLAGLIILYGGVLNLLVRHLLVSPIVRVSEVARRFGAGDLSVRADINSHDELGQLAQVLNHTADTLEAQQKALIEDVRQRSEVAEELAIARDEAVGATRAKSDFLATMCHEIRTPMNGVLGILGLLVDTTLDPQQTEFVETARRSADSLMTVINDILDFSKIEAGKLGFEPVPFDLQDAVGDVAEMLSTKADEKGIELLVRYSPGTPRQAVGDAGRIRQILNNLVGNAIKFTERGQVEICVSAIIQEVPLGACETIDAQASGAASAPGVSRRSCPPGG